MEKAKANAVADARLEHRSEQIEALELQTTELQVCVLAAFPWV